MNGKPARPSRPRTRRRGFSLASILLLTVLVAVFFAAVATGMMGRDRPNKDLLAGCAVGGSVLGSVVGTAIGLNRDRRIRGLVLGLLAGAISGAMAGVLLAIPQSLPATIVGALVLLVFSGVVRYFSPPPPPP